MKFPFYSDKLKKFFGTVSCGQTSSMSLLQ